LKLTLSQHPRRLRHTRRIDTTEHQTSSLQQCFNVGILNQQAKIDDLEALDLGLVGLRFQQGRQKMVLSKTA
jgi:hypothetical protein